MSVVPDAAPEVAGTRPLSHGRVLRIAVPVVISNATIPLLGIVDTAVVGQIGDPVPIGAVGLGAAILTSIYWAFGFLRMGTVGLAAQAIGARDAGEVAALLTRVLMIGAGAGVALILLQIPLFAAALWLSPASAEVEALVSTYLTIRVLSAPAAIAIYGITGWLIAQERTSAVLALQLFQNGLNIVLSAILVLGLDLGVAGVAWGTFVAEWSGLALGLWLCRAAFGVPAWRDWARVLDRAQLWRMASVNADILIRSLLLMAGFTSFMFLASDFGDVTLAANQVLIQFVYVTAHAMDGFAFAAEALVGQAMGARAAARLRRAALLTSFWGLVICCVMAVLFLTAGGAFIDLMTTAPGVREAARDYLPWMVLGPLAGWASWMLDGIFIGATRTRDMRNMMALSFAGYVAMVLLLMPAFGNHGLWAALVGFFVLRGVTLGVRYPALERAAS
ncbi:MATE family efflux transporter [Roseibacterium sp. SDUM158017]|uniref:MATE family efflux transporter n=1 Tax=Roseicyclus salinarum TaxID=3036773 RepID=UPI0024150603|nr:MATE family efflux transporter [Roseibacterium sp. SDUM158017]MDG4649695.1 MATE family efflux transporter [Roseibacterium sp. SDUM158017]